MNESDLSVSKLSSVHTELGGDLSPQSKIVYRKKLVEEFGPDESDQFSVNEENKKLGDTLYKINAQPQQTGQGFMQKPPVVEKIGI